MRHDPNPLHAWLYRCHELRYLTAHAQVCVRRFGHHVKSSGSWSHDPPPELFDDVLATIRRLRNPRDTGRPVT